jgi:hypothetical protein
MEESYASGLFVVPKQAGYSCGLQPRELIMNTHDGAKGPMVRLEFGVVHDGCTVNELSRALPDIRFICPGGFVLSESSAEEIIVIDEADDNKIEATLAFLHASEAIAQASLIERTRGKAFIRILTQTNPESGFCSDAVSKHKGFKLGHEIQFGGVECWAVGCFLVADAANILRDIAAMGEIKHQRISESTWHELLEAMTSDKS